MGTVQREEMQKMFDEFMERVNREGLKCAEFELQAKGFFTEKGEVVGPIIRRGTINESFAIK